MPTNNSWNNIVPDNDITISSGNLILTDTTALTVGVIEFGSSSRAHCFGDTTNLFIGKTAGNFTMSGATNNVGIGRDALKALTTGDLNCAVGDGTSYTITQGIGNTSLGYNTCTVTTGNYNTCIGYSAGSAIIGNETSNILIGASATGTVSTSHRLVIGSGTGTALGQLDKAFIHGINGASTGGASTVPYINSSTSQLGVTAGGAVTMNTGTQSLSISSDASATTVNVGTGAAAKTVTVGSTNTTSSLALKYGTSDFTLASATGTVMSALDSGEITKPLQPAFLAINSSDDNNVTGAGTQYKLEFDLERFDQGSDYNTTTDTFTAPVTGKYFLGFHSRINEVGAGMDNLQCFITTSSEGYRGTRLSPVACQSSTNHIDFQSYVLAQMDAADTATVSVIVSGGGGDTADVDGSAVTPITRFFGYLVA